jgi:hypothetical protein
MNEYMKFFKCEYCKGSSFEKLYSFNVSFREVNFTDEFIYNENIVTRYKCKQCEREYDANTIKQTLKEIIRKYKENYWEQEMESM